MKPYWTDYCKHNRPNDKFLGSVIVDEDKYDIYIYQDNALSDKPDMHLCFRYGNECFEYISPGSLDMFMKLMKEENDSALYLKAFALISGS